MQFAKIENGVLKRCPKSGKVGKLMHTNLPLYFENHPETAYAEGWRELVLTDKPDGAYTLSYTEDGNQVVQTWSPVEPAPQEPTIEDKVDDLAQRMEVTEGALLELADEVYKAN